MITINNTMPGVIKNIEVKGNTYQDPNNLSKIVSAGIPNGDGTYKMSILSVGENIFNGKFELGSLNGITGQDLDSTANCRSGFIKVGSKQISWLLENSSGGYIFTYDKDKNFISSRVNAGTYRNYTLEDNAVYIRVRLQDANVNTKMTIVHGIVGLTNHIPYQETRCDIKLPCQLEKVWETCDKLYYDFEKSSWCISKIIDTLNPLDYTWYRAEQYVKCSRMAIKDGSQNSIIGAKSGVLGMVSNALTFMSGNQDEPHLRIDGGLPYGNVNVYIEGLNASESDLKAFAKSNNMFIKYIRRDAKIIELPQSEQIKLNSFANKTHIYTISGEVDATVKATVSKSLASTVQANTEEISKINNTIADIQGLKESQDFEYELPSGQNYLVCKDTQNGVVKDLKMYGKSIMNVAPKSIAPIKLNIDKRVNDTALISPIRANTEFTVGVNITAKKAPLKGLLVSFHFTDGTFAYEVLSTGVYSQFKTFKFNKDIKAISEYLHADELSADSTANITFDSLIVCEGVVNTYFEGIASVGNGNEIEVSSGSKNIAYEVVMGSVGSSGEMIESSNSNRLNMTRVIPNTKYIFSKDSVPRNCNKFFYDIEGTCIGQDFSSGTNSVFTTSNNCYYVVLTWGSSQEVGKYQLEIGNTVTSYVEPKQDKKTILFKDSDNTWKPILNLRGIDENNCDIIDSSNNKYIVKYEKYVFNGTESWSITPTDASSSQDQLMFTLRLINNGKLNGNCLSDKFIRQTVPYNYSGECFVAVHANGNTYIRINKSRLETQDVVGFKKWLQSNNVTVIYELNESQQYEINPIFPSSYDNETMILFGSGVIAPYASWKITSHAANIIKNQGQRLTRLENDFYKYTVVQNRIMLDSRYAADNATFKIDTSIYSSNNVTASNLHASICEVKETHQDIKYDFDLYKLIKRNILVGKDNYDRAWMEECITFYWMDFKISDQMHAELNEIIENQYNPPVDMTPIEPPMEDVVEEIPQA